MEVWCHHGRIARQFRFLLLFYMDYIAFYSVIHHFLRLSLPHGKHWSLFKKYYKDQLGQLLQPFLLSFCYDQLWQSCLTTTRRQPPRCLRQLFPFFCFSCPHFYFLPSISQPHVYLFGCFFFFLSTPVTTSVISFCYLILVDFNSSTMFTLFICNVIHIMWQASDFHYRQPSPTECWRK